MALRRAVDSMGVAAMASAAQTMARIAGGGALASTPQALGEVAAARSLWHVLAHEINPTLLK